MKQKMTVKEKVSKLTGASVYCDAQVLLPTTAGWTTQRTPADPIETHLSATTCRRLRRLSEGWRPRTDPQLYEAALALFTVAHEWGHVDQIRRGAPVEEKGANAFAAKNFGRVAYAFGLGPTYRKQLLNRMRDTGLFRGGQ